MNSKVCSKCGKEKKSGEFNSKGESGYLQTYCKRCQYDFQMNRWKERKKQAVEYLGGKCMKCGYAKNFASLAFHHRDPDAKECSWTKLRLKSWDKITKELDKCDCICSNCHGELHNPDCEM